MDTTHMQQPHPANPHPTPGVRGMDQHTNNTDRSAEDQPPPSSDILNELQKSIDKCQMSLPQDELLSICRSEVLRFQSLEALESQLRYALHSQQMLLHDAFECFGGVEGGGGGGGQVVGGIQNTPKGISSKILRMHIYNTYRNQKVGDRELDTYMTESLVNQPPPSWTLRIQGGLLARTDSRSSSSSSSSRQTPRMTSFFRRIMVITKKDSLIWDRRTQQLQLSSSGPVKQPFTRLVQQAVRSSSEGINTTQVTVRGDTTTKGIINNNDNNNNNNNNSISTKMDSWKGEGVKSAGGGSSKGDGSSGDLGQPSSPCLSGIETIGKLSSDMSVDCDCLEICRAGDVEEDIYILFFMDYKTPQYALSPKLSEIVGVSQASLSTIVRAIWDKAKSLSKMPDSSGTTTLPTDDALRQLFGSSSPTFDLRDLRQLLAPHLSSPAPICVSYKIRLSGDFISNERVLDFTVDTYESLYPLDTAIAPWNKYVIGKEGCEPITLSTIEKIDKIKCWKFDNLMSDGTPDPTDMWRPIYESDTLERVGSLNDIYNLNSRGMDDSVANHQELKHSEIKDEIKSKGNSMAAGTNIDTTSTDAEILNLMNQISRLLSHRNYFISFSEHPARWMSSLLNSRHIEEQFNRQPLLSKEFLYEYELAETRSDFYKQPWAQLAVERYVNNYKKNFDDLIGKSLASISSERKPFISSTTDPVVNMLSQSFNKSSSGRVQSTGQLQTSSSQQQSQQQQQHHLSFHPTSYIHSNVQSRHPLLSHTYNVHQQPHNYFSTNPHLPHQQNQNINNNFVNPYLQHQPLPPSFGAGGAMGGYMYMQ